MNWSAAEERALKQLIDQRIDIKLLRHLQILHPYQPQEISGTDSSDVKLDIRTTQPLILETDITELSSSLLLLGEVLEELDSLINTATKLRSNLLRFYNDVPVGSPGPPVQESSASVKERWRCHCGDTTGCTPGKCLNVPA